MCENVEGSYLCSCHEGHVLADNHTCVDEDECAEDNGGCQQVRPSSWLLNTSQHIEMKAEISELESLILDVQTLTSKHPLVRDPWLVIRGSCPCPYIREIN